MKIKFLRTYKKNGNPVFVYEVNANQAEVEKLKEAQGDYFRLDEVTGKPLFFTTKNVGNTGKLIITAKGQVLADMSEYEAAASLVAQFGGNFGQELAKASVAKLMGGSRPNSSAEDTESSPFVENPESEEV
jgi:hypothetical protein